ncbi:hypothetical protein QOZ80_9AG0673040 [Eleusine coracana subsp. coracana]|nr:hypothetical protein QOZ80_9AG0673040 [Eleusine coracana subsp. coracana]
MVDLGSASSGIKKLNSHNYGYWKTCMESYLQGQDLWEVIEGAKAVPPEKESALRKWRIKAGHFARNCWLPKKRFEGNMATTTMKKEKETPVSEEEWDTEAGFSLEVDEEELEEDMEAPSFAATTTPALNYKEDWIVDSGCSNHMTNDYKKLEDMADYKGRRVVLTADNTKLPISHVGKATISRYGPQQLQLEKVYHVPELKKNLLSVPQLIAEGKYVLFGPNKVAIFGQVKVIGTPIMEGKRRQSVYVLSVQEAYVDKTRKNETGDLWHARLGHVNYNKLKEMMRKQVLKGLPQVDIRTDMVCEGCQYGKAHQLPYKESEHQSKTPLELIHSDVFGPIKQKSLGGMRYMVTFIDDFSTSKFEKKAIRCIFVGYDDARKGWRCCDPTTGKCHTSRNVVFDEASAWWVPEKIKISESPTLEEVLEETKEGEEEEKSTPREVIEESPSKAKNPWKTGVHQTAIEEPHQQLELEEPTQGLRTYRRRKNKPRYANAALVDNSIPIEPSSYEEAAQGPEWLKAMEDEIKALNENQTWDLVPRPKDVKPISCKWVYKVKTCPDGSIERYKARLVARGFSQQYGLDYEETFSPVAKITTIRVLLALTACKSWKLWQMDVKNAFLHGELDKDIYMEQPRGFESKIHPEYVCKLKKALYGLKQAPRAWYGKIGEFLIQSGFNIAPSDSSLFVKAKEGRLAIVLVYVDDLIITGDYLEEIQRTRENLSVRFQMKELGELRHFLGLEMEHMKEGLFLGQQKYAKDLLQRYGMLDCKPISTPMDPNVRLREDEGKELEDVTMYRQMVGSLIYLTLTRPDISYSVGVVSRYMSKPNKHHLGIVRRILRLALPPGITRVCASSEGWHCHPEAKKAAYSPRTRR